MPIEEPKLAGFTKQGYFIVLSISSKMDFINKVFNRSFLFKAIYGAWGRLNDLKIDFIAILSIPTDEPRIPDPTKGFPVNLNNPWIDPSSPLGPCNAGNHMSILLLAFGRLVKLFIKEINNTVEFFTKGPIAFIPIPDEDKLYCRFNQVEITSEVGPDQISSRDFMLGSYPWENLYRPKIIFNEIKQNRVNLNEYKKSLDLLIGKFSKTLFFMLYLNSLLFC